MQSEILKKYADALAINQSGCPNQRIQARFQDIQPKFGRTTCSPTQRHKTKKRKHLSLQFFAFSYLHGLHEMMVLLHFDFIREVMNGGSKRKEKKKTNPNPKEMKI